MKSRLYTPGPVQVSDTVRLSTSIKTFGSREPEFCEKIVNVRSSLHKISELGENYTVLLIQGSGTYGVESVIQTAVPSDARFLVVSNGTFGERMAKIGKYYVPGLKHVEMKFNEPLDLDLLEKEITSYKPTHLGLVHSETSTGIINDVETIGKRFCIGKDLVFIVDGISSFGGIEYNIEKCGIDFLAGSPNKCLESLAGVGIIIARRDQLIKSYSRTLVLDLVDQYNFFEKYKMFRFTPPLECIVALEQACTELLEETVKGRAERYKKNTQYLRKEMKRIGFKAYLSDENNGHIVSLYDYPPSPKFNFEEFYNELCKKGCRIYFFPGKRIDREVIRIGTIGSNNVEHFKILIQSIEEICKEKGYF